MLGRITINMSTPKYPIARSRIETCAKILFWLIAGATFFAFPEGEFNPGKRVEIAMTVLGGLSGGLLLLSGLEVADRHFKKPDAVVWREEDGALFSSDSGVSYRTSAKDADGNFSYPSDGCFLPSDYVWWICCLIVGAGEISYLLGEKLIWEPIPTHYWLRLIVFGMLTTLAIVRLWGIHKTAQRLQVWFAELAQEKARMEWLANAALAGIFSRDEVLTAIANGSADEIVTHSQFWPSSLRIHNEC